MKMFKKAILLIQKITYELWIDKAKQEIEYLINKGYKKIYVLGHSMGGVIATYIATQYKEVKKLVLAAPAFEYFGYFLLYFFSWLLLLFHGTFQQCFWH